MLADIFRSVIVYIKSNPSESSSLICILLLSYYLIIYPYFLSPLKNIPGPYLHRISKLPALNKQRKADWIDTVHNLHLRYGNVVILSPNEISVNGKSKFVNDIYIRNFPKSKFYENFRNHGFKDNIFASLENNRHLSYKKIIMHLYSKSSIFSNKNPARGILAEKVSHLVNAVYKSSVIGQEPDYINAKSEMNEYGKGHSTKDGKWFNPSGKIKNLGIDVYSLFGSLAMDVVSSFELGKENGTDLLLRPDKRHILVSHRLQASMGFWTTLMPKFWNWAASKDILEASSVVEEWQLSVYDKAEKNVPKFKEDENLTTLETLKKNGLTGESAYSFLSDNIFAGHETTAIQLTYLTYELSRPVNLSRQQFLIKELVENFGKPSSPNDVISDLEKVDSLPYLNALLEENSRVHTSIPGAEPRVVDKPYRTTLDNGTLATIPVGTIISCQPFSIHRQHDVFPDPYNFIPERWLNYENESVQDFNQRIFKQQKHMMPFGKGIRMCLGMNLALIEMKLAIANLYWHFNSKICSDWCYITDYHPSEKKPNPIKIGDKYKGNNQSDEEKMVMIDTYTTRPLNDECWLEWYEN